VQMILNIDQVKRFNFVTRLGNAGTRSQVLKLRIHTKNGEPNIYPKARSWRETFNECTSFRWGMSYSAREVWANRTGRADDAPGKNMLNLRGCVIKTYKILFKFIIFILYIAFFMKCGILIWTTVWRMHSSMWTSLINSSFFTLEKKQ
jgi:hypothetical protein